jgi:hypothetical protein
MWILKGLALGSAIFFVGTVAFLFIAVLRPVKANTATGLSVLYGVTFANPYFWVALVACLALGVCVLASWPVQIQN